MKKVLSLILVLVLCLGLCACGFDQEAYNTHLAGKTFESNGRVLKFDNDACMTYKYTNMIGDTFRYTYSIEKISTEEDRLVLTLKMESANNNSENSDKDKEIEAIYYISQNILEYYSVQYECVK